MKGKNMGTIGKTIGAVVLAALIASGVAGEQEVTRTPRGNTSETGAVTRESRGSSTQAQPTGIQTGEWELEGESMFDVLYVTIDRNNGYAEQGIAQADPTELAAEVGLTYIGEASAPEGCRLLTFSGPLGIAMFVFMCADSDFYMYGITTDRDAADHAMGLFADGKPYTPPFGWHPVL